MSVDLCKLCIENKKAFCYNVGVKEGKGMNEIKNETILQAQLGVPEALDVIIDTYSKLAYYQAIKYLQIRDDAKDCAQEAISLSLSGTRRVPASDYHQLLYSRCCHSCGQRYIQWSGT